MNNTGGPAFPVPDIDGSAVAEGMTLLDYFAAHASEEDIKYWMPAGFNLAEVKQIHDGADPTGSRKVIHHIPGMYTREQARYRYANAMLRARKA